jgi:hypothetical protein
MEVENGRVFSEIFTLLILTLASGHDVPSSLLLRQWNLLSVGSLPTV